MNERPSKRHDNGGLRKVCGCARKKWAKCSHPWHVNVTINGLHIRKSLAKVTKRTITSKTEAEAAFEAFKVQLRNAPAVTKDAALTPPMTLGEMLDAYQRDDLSLKPAAEDTETMIAAIKRTRLPIPNGAQAFGDWLVNDVAEAQLWAYKTARSRKTPARKKDGTEYRRQMGGAVAVNRDLQLIRRAYNWALSARPDDVHTSPFKTGKPPKGLFTKERPRCRRLHGDEADRLLRACGTTLRPLVEAALETGCRQANS